VPVAGLDCGARVLCGPLPVSHRMGEGEEYRGGATQGGARASLALGWYVSPFQGF